MTAQQMQEHEPDSKTSVQLQATVRPSANAVLSGSSKPGVLSRLFFLFVDPIIRSSHSCVLQPEQLYQPDSFTTKELYNTVNTAWQQQQKDATKDPSLCKALILSCLRPALLASVLMCVSLAAELVGPMMLQTIVTGLQCSAGGPAYDGGGQTCPSQQHLYYYVIAISLAPLVQALADSHLQFQMTTIGLKLRNGLMAAIYRKCLRLSSSTLQSDSVGKVITLMSNDAQKVLDLAMVIQPLWACPLFIIVTLGLLYKQIGWAAGVCLAVLLLFMPLSAQVSRKLVALRSALVKWTDQRVELMSEIINSIQMIKLHAWEAPFEQSVKFVRAKETAALRRMVWWQSLLAMLLFSGPVLMALAAFGAYAIAGNRFTAANAYTALALLGLIREPLVSLPSIITMLGNALIACQRIAQFLMRPESAVADVRVAGSKVATGEVKVESASFSWHGGDTSLALSGISLHAKPGALTMVIGNVGSGKSSLLSALVGQLQCTGGNVAVGGICAYVAQTAWLMNETLKENIIMGSAHNPDRYNEAVQVCQLLPDVAALPHGDASVIADRGVSLSGGQKQRISIARAVYSNADVILLDDPLSALDSTVARAVFDECIRGALADKTVVMVTHAWEYLGFADNIVWMEDGRIKAQGGYDELVAAGLPIADLQRHHHAAAAATPAPCPQLALVSAAEQDSASNKTSAVTHCTLQVVDGAVLQQSQQPSSGVKQQRQNQHQPHALPLQKADHETCRQPSRSSNHSTTQQNLEASCNQTGVEAREQGIIAWHVLSSYVRAGGGLGTLLIVLVAIALEQGARVLTDIWLGWWSGDKFSREVWFYIGVYAAAGALYSVLTFNRALGFLYSTVRASLQLHNQLLHHVLNLPKSFFDTNSVGRIINRFSRDTEIMDGILGQNVMQFCNAFATYLAALAVISFATRWFAIGVVPITVIYVILQRWYIPAAREVQRIEAITRSPIYTKYSEAISGVATICAYRMEDYLIRVSDNLMELNAHAVATQRAASAWLAMRLDFLGACILTLTAVLCVQGNISPSWAGLCLLYALDLTRFLKQGTTMASRTESNLNAVERVVQYLDEQPEAPGGTNGDSGLKPTPSTGSTLICSNPWPSAGAISVQGLSLRHRVGLPLALRDVSFDINGGEKVGLVGRTGSGKSSLVLSLSRMIEADTGAIFIDGADISTLSLRQLRSNLSVIPQDPCLFRGTIRSNIDPTGSHTDLEIWQVLEAVSMKCLVAAEELKLDASVAAGGSNYSQGQKQLLCMARAMLRNSRILILDEATASIDQQSDKLLQLALTVAFKEATVLTVAHRLSTVMNSDRILLLDQGRLVENDHPQRLLLQPDSRFATLVSHGGELHRVGNTE